MIEILFAIIIGCILGIFTGLTPGVHINLVAVIIFSISSTITNLFSVNLIVIALISMGIVHTFLDIIPTTFLGLPDEDNIMAALPAHKLTLEGKAKVAITISAIGAFSGLLIILSLSPLVMIYLKNIYEVINPLIAYILIWVSIMSLYSSNNKLNSLFIFLLSGLFGYLILNSKVIIQPLLPMLSGLFGVSALLFSINLKTKIPKQVKDTEIKFKDLGFFRNSSSGIISCLLTSFLPGLTASHTTMIASYLSKIKSSIDYLFINSCIGTVSMFLSLIAIYSIGKARNGVIIVISNLVNIDQQLFLILICSILISSSIAIILLFKLTDISIKLMEKINYLILCGGLIIFIVILVFLISGWIGLVVLTTSTAIGILPYGLNVEKMHTMGVILIPVIIFFLF